MKSANAAIGKTETPIPTPTNEEVADAAQAVPVAAPRALRIRA